MVDVVAEYTSSGVSQRRLAARIGMSQSEISEILGGRRVLAYDVPALFADRLEIPRGDLGLASDESTVPLLADSGDRASP